MPLRTIAAITLLAALIIIINGITAINPAYAQRSDFNDFCNRCHSNPNLEMTFPSAEVINLFIDPEEYERNSHGMEDISCNQCHIEIDSYPHPVITAANYREYETNLNLECIACHPDQGVINPDNVHVTAVKSGDPVAPICSDCHGSHYIFAVDDPRSPVSGDNLLVTCAQCHENAPSNFSDSLVPHSPPSPTQWPLVYFIRLYYKILIPTVLLGIILLGLIEYVRRYTDLRKGRKLVKAGVFLWLPNSYKFELWILGINLGILTITGLVHMNADASVSQWFIERVGGIPQLRVIHLIGGVVMIAQVLIHVIVLYSRHIKLKRLFRIVPSPSDLRSAALALSYNIGVLPDKPKPKRYVFVMKLQHWAIVWGALVIMISGLILWNPIATANIFPGQIIPAAKAAHGSEAVLAVLSAIAWHFYIFFIKRLKRKE